MHMTKECVLVTSAAMMFSTWAGAEVQHVDGCDGRCDAQRRLDIQAGMRRESMARALAGIDEAE